MPSRDGQKRLVREGEPSQKTEEGLGTPVSKKSEVMDLFNRAASERSRQEPSRSAKGRRRTSHDGR